MTRLSGRWPRLLIAGAAVATAFAAAACGGGSEAQSSGTSPAAGSAGSANAVVVEATEFEFGSGEVVLGAGTKVTLTNKGNIEHDITVDGAGIQFMAMPGETVTEPIELEPGTYTFYCSVAGHREAGMEGTLVVES